MVKVNAHVSKDDSEYPESNWKYWYKSILTVAIFNDPLFWGNYISGAG